MDYLIKASPEAVVATGQTHLNGHEDVAYMTLYFPEKVIAHVNVNWLSPVKVRTTLIGGEKRMVVWNDLEADEKLKVYDRGVDVTNREGVYELLVNYRSVICGLLIWSKWKRCIRSCPTLWNAFPVDRSRSTMDVQDCGW
jgi:predicted dehydrogenase